MNLAGPTTPTLGPTIVLKDGITPEDVEKLRATVQDAVRDGRIVTVQIAPHESIWPKYIDLRENAVEVVETLRKTTRRSTPVSVKGRRGKSIFGGGIMGNLVARLFPSFQAILNRKKGGRA